MGATPSKEEPAAKKDVIRGDVDAGFFSSLWLCGGGDAVDDKAIEKVRKHNDRNGEIRTQRVNDAARVTESADLFVREFKQTMRERGFAAFKYNRNGRAAPRIFQLDVNEQSVQWKTKKTAKVVNGDKFDSLLLVDIEDVSRGCEPRASRLLQGDEAKRVLTIHCAARRLQGRKRVRNSQLCQAPISVGFHSFRLIFGRAIISRNGLEA